MISDCTYLVSNMSAAFLTFKSTSKEVAEPVKCRDSYYVQPTPITSLDHIFALGCTGHIQHLDGLMANLVKIIFSVRGF